REAARIAADVIGRRWGDPGAGIWETEDRLWTHSRLICVAGLRQAARVLGGPGESASWNSLADAVLAETARTA
ncbi:glycoside hydrolase family 15 protein, partial [Actinomadura bangladeshensis]|nr:glycoside hydrolase family 15 protein [Actinomadura bangladeshensis]